MSASTQTPTSTRAPGSPSPSPSPARSKRELTRSGALVVLAVLITLFAVFNTDRVKVHWVFGTDEAPLIIVIVVSLLVGVVLTHFAERRSAKRR
jgi:uncharacterized integral membrane protein